MPFRTVFAAVSLFALATPAIAHHSHAMYDEETRVTVEATVTEFTWTNPHSWVYLNVAEANGETTEWVFETGPTGELTSRGWSADVLKPGDVITATFNSLKDGSKGGLLGIIVLPDGREIRHGGSFRD